MDNDARAILGVAPQLVTGQEGLNDIRVVNAIFKAARTGEKVML